MKVDLTDDEIRGAIKALGEARIKDPSAFYAYCPKCEDVHSFHGKTNIDCGEALLKTTKEVLRGK